jgi:hypothetical protein
MIKELFNLPAAKLKRAVKLKTEIEKLELQFENVIAAATPSPVGRLMRARRRMTTVARRKISIAAKARWAKAKAAASRN